MKKIYFARHGQTNANLAKKFSGGLAIPLNETGHRQAEALGEAVLDLPEKVDVIIASTATRAQETASLVAGRIGLPEEQIVKDVRIREADFGTFNGKDFTPENIAERDQNFLAASNANNVESMHLLLERLRSFKQEVERRPEDTLLVIGHGFSGRMLIRLFAGIELTQPIPHFNNADVFQLHPFIEMPEGDLVLL